MKGPPGVCSSGRPGSKFVGIKRRNSAPVPSSLVAVRWQRGSKVLFRTREQQTCCVRDTEESASLSFSLLNHLIAPVRVQAVHFVQPNALHRTGLSVAEDRGRADLRSWHGCPESEFERIGLHLKGAQVVTGARQTDVGGTATDADLEN